MGRGQDGDAVTVREQHALLCERRALDVGYPDWHALGLGGGIGG